MSFQAMRVFGIRPEERSRILLLVLHNMFVVGVTIAGKSVRDAYFLTRFNKDSLALMMCLVAVAVAVTVAVYAKMQSKISPERLLPGTAILFAVSLALIHLKLEGFMVAVLYVWMEVINVIAVQQFWLLASDICDARQAKRLFPLLGGGGSVAAILTGWQLKPFTSTYGPENLLWLVCALLVALGGVSMATARLPRAPVSTSQRPTGPRGKRSWGKYLQIIALLVVTASLVAGIVDYQFKIISSSTLRSEEDLIGFFGHFYATTGLSTLLLQFVVARIVFQRFGVAVALLVLPVGLGLSSSAILMWPILSSVVAAKFADQTFRFTLHNGGLELLWLPVSLEQRRDVRPFITGTLKSAAEALTGLGMFLLIRVLSVPQLSYVALGCTGVWILSALRLRSLYIHQLQSAIEKHQLPPEELEITADDAVTVGVFERALAGGDPVQQLVALDLIQKMPLKEWAQTLRRLLQEAAPEVRVRILEVAAGDTAVVTDDYLRVAIESEGITAAPAARIAGRLRLQQLAPALNRLRGHEDPTLCAASLMALIRLTANDRASIFEELKQMHASPNPAVRVAALAESAIAEGGVPRDLILRALRDPTTMVRAQALEIAAYQQNAECISAVVDCLKTPELQMSARHALAAFPAQAVLAQLVDRLSIELPLSERMLLVRSLRSCRIPETYLVLLGVMDDRYPAMSDAASDVLLRLTRDTPSPGELRPLVERHWKMMARTAYVLTEALRLLPDREDTLLRDHLSDSIRQTLIALIRLGALAKPDWPVETCIQIIVSGDRARLPFVLELLDAILPPEDRERITPLIEHIPLERRMAAGRKHFSDIPIHIDEWLLSAIHSGNEWRCAIVLDFALRTERGLSGHIDWSRVPATMLVTETLSRNVLRDPELESAIPLSHRKRLVRVPVQENRSMFTTLEKTLLLKSVSVFKEIPSEELAHVAQIAEQVEVAAGSAIFKEGDHGDCLYILLSGCVRVHKGDKELAVLGRLESLGEMAVLDGAPRSASATAIAETGMLKVGREDFMEVMRGSPEIMQGIIRLLLMRLREANEKLFASR